MLQHIEAEEQVDPRQPVVHQISEREEATRRLAMDLLIAGDDRFDDVVPQVQPRSEEVEQLGGVATASVRDAMDLEAFQQIGEPRADLGRPLRRQPALLVEPRGEQALTLERARQRVARKATVERRLTHDLGGHVDARVAGELLQRANGAEAVPIELDQVFRGAGGIDAQECVRPTGGPPLPLRLLRAEVGGHQRPAGCLHVVVEVVDDVLRGRVDVPSRRPEPGSHGDLFARDVQVGVVGHVVDPLGAAEQEASRHRGSWGGQLGHVLRTTVEPMVHHDPASGELPDAERRGVGTLHGERVRRLVATGVGADHGLLRRTRRDRLDHLQVPVLDEPHVGVDLEGEVLVPPQPKHLGPGPAP